MASAFSLFPSTFSSRPFQNGAKIRSFPVRVSSSSSSSPLDTASLSDFKLFNPPQVESTSSELESADPDFYRIGYVRSMRAYGVEFMEGPNGFGVFATRDVEPLRRARASWLLNPI